MTIQEKLDKIIEILSSPLIEYTIFSDDSDDVIIDIFKDYNNYLDIEISDKDIRIQCSRNGKYFDFSGFELDNDVHMNLLKYSCAEILIPKGLYCYEVDDNGDNYRGNIKIKLCPYWDIHPMMDEQCNGYCHYLKEGDWQESISFLWDQVKECSINF